MSQWDLTPDPYTYRPGRVEGGYTGNRRCYIVSLKGADIGVIVPVQVSTDTKIAGTRLRRPGRGRDGFAAICPNRHSFTGAPLPGFGRYIERDRRRDAADDLTWLARRDDWTDAFLANAIAHFGGG